MKISLIDNVMYSLVIIAIAVFLTIGIAQFVKMPTPEQDYLVAGLGTIALLYGFWVQYKIRVRK